MLVSLAAAEGLAAGFIASRVGAGQGLTRRGSLGRFLMNEELKPVADQLGHGFGLLMISSSAWWMITPHCREVWPLESSSPAAANSSTVPLDAEERLEFRGLDRVVPGPPEGELSSTPPGLRLDGPDRHRRTRARTTRYFGTQRSMP